MELKIKTIIAALAMLSCQLVEATHLIGGHLTYVWVSSTATTVTYNIRLRLIADQSGIGLGTTESVNLNATNGTFAATPQLQRYMSVYSISSGCETAYAADYRADVTVPKDKNIKITYHTCCRPSSYTSMVNASVQQLYLDAMIMGTPSNPRGFDNGVNPLATALHSSVVGMSSYIPFQWSEPDGDSVHVSIIPSRGYDAPSSSVVNVSYASGYTWNQPVPNNGGTDSLTLDYTSRTLSVVPNAIGRTSVALKFSNYYFDSTFFTVLLAGYSTAEVPVSMLANPLTGMALSLGGVQTSGEFQGQTTIPFYSGSFTGSEFLLETISGQVLASGLDRVELVNPHLGNQLSFFLDTTLTSGNYQLRIAAGADSNTLVGQCGATLPVGLAPIFLPFDTAWIAALSAGGGSGVYQLSNASNLDSVTWSAIGAQLSQNGTVYGAQLTTTTNNPVDVAMYAPFGELRALRHGAGGATSLATFVLTSGIGTDEPSVTQSRVHPNPTSGTASLVTDFFGTYELLSVFGALLERGTIPSEIDLSSYPQGVYLLALTGDGRTETLRIVRR